MMCRDCKKQPKKEDKYTKNIDFKVRKSRFFFKLCVKSKVRYKKAKRGMARKAKIALRVKYIS